jgi:hypothetical protein
VGAVAAAGRPWYLHARGSFHWYRPDYWFAMGRVSTRSITCDCETISAGRGRENVVELLLLVVYAT